MYRLKGGGGEGWAEDAWDDHKEKEEITVLYGAQRGGQEV